MRYLFYFLFIVCVRECVCMYVCVCARSGLCITAYMLRSDNFENQSHFHFVKAQRSLWLLCSV